MSIFIVAHIAKNRPHKIIVNHFPDFLGQTPGFLLERKRFLAKTNRFEFVNLHETYTKNIVESIVQPEGFDNGSSKELPGTKVAPIQGRSLPAAEGKSITNL